MAEIVKMPKLSDTMEEGVVAEWHKKVGDEVKSGEVLAEIETDKATMEFESFQDGVLLHIGVPKGQAAPVDSILAILGKKGEDIKSLLESGASSSSETAPKATSEKAESKSISDQPVAIASKTESAVKEPVSKERTVETSIDSNQNGRLKASPLARKMADDKGIDLHGLTGSGDGGRIVRKDVENFASPSAKKANSAVGAESYTEETVSQMRKTIAKRLSDSKFTAPHFYLTMEIDMDQAVSSRAAVNAAIAPAKVSINDLVIKAAAAALKRHPQVNSSWLGDRIRHNEHIHIGVAVAVDEGLLVPVVRFADTKSMLAINEEVKTFADKARNKKLQPQDWAGNTFTISNLGMFGIEEFTAIINTPDACIMAVGAVVEKPVVKKGTIVIGQTMKVTLSCDHRVVDGAVGSAFLQTFKKYMENPIMMIAE